MYLRKWTIQDIQGLSLVMNNADHSYLSNGLPYPYTEDHARWWINMVSEKDEKSGLYRAIVLDDKVIGMVSLEQKSDVYEKDSEVSYLIMEEYHGKGIITQAVKEICKEAFEKLDILRITGCVFDENAASKKVLIKNGFIQEGILKNAVYKNGRIMDLCYYGLYK